MRIFEEKLDLFAALLSEEEVTWKGNLRPPLERTTVYPRPVAPLKTGVGVGGSPQSVVRAPHYRLPVMLAIIGGDPIRFQPHAELYRRALGEFGKAEQPIGVHSPGHVAATDAEARERF